MKFPKPSVRMVKRTPRYSPGFKYRSIITPRGIYRSLTVRLPVVNRSVILGLKPDDPAEFYTESQQGESL
ncbi:hypothetical protein HRTV-11_gp90 [Halorubrum virus HRTV-11]|nr:hypothetical protein HRTV-2_gp88 [Halorubrum virus HRTV-2]UBF22347.1 hypothetical protein HRTV-11_gp90 [Halorubrum virus HRTV-11]